VFGQHGREHAGDNVSSSSHVIGQDLPRCNKMGNWLYTSEGALASRATWLRLRMMEKCLFSRQDREPSEYGGECRHDEACQPLDAVAFKL
jgi:hypothetical protein